jgi:hypothetical protein
MKVTLNYTSSVLDALVEAGRFEYRWDYAGTSYRKTYICQGHRFSSTKAFCLWMIEQMEWMVPNNVPGVSLIPLINAVYATHRTIPCFEIEE